MCATAASTTIRPGGMPRPVKNRRPCLAACDFQSVVAQLLEIALAILCKLDDRLRHCHCHGALAVGQPELAQCGLECRAVILRGRCKDRQQLRDASVLKFEHYLHLRLIKKTIRTGNESPQRTFGQTKQWPNRPWAKRKNAKAFRKSNRTGRSARGSQTRPWHPSMTMVSRIGLGKSSPGRLRI
jgi:hypothetical protein